MNIQRLRELHQQATITPWRTRHIGDDSVGDECWVVEDIEGEEIANGFLDAKANLDLIAAMRNTLPYLLDIAEAAQAVEETGALVIDPEWRTLHEALNRLEQGGFGG